MGATTPSIGQVLGHYRIVEQVGAGGMGVVFRAHDEQLDRDVALKIMPQVALLSEPARRQFRREALSLARITDPNVAMAFDFGRDQGFDYLVTEYVPGITLRAKIAGRPLPGAEGLERVILRTLQKDPAERYQSAGDLRFDLNSLATGTAPVYATPRTPRWLW